MRKSLNKVFVNKDVYINSIYKYRIRTTLAAACREKKLNIIIQILKDVGLVSKEACKIIT